MDAQSKTTMNWTTTKPTESISMKSQPPASPATSSSLKNVIMSSELSVALSSEQADIIIAAAWRTARLPPETAPMEVVMMPVVMTPGEIVGGGLTGMRSEPQIESVPGTGEGEDELR